MTLETTRKASDVYGIGRDLPLNYVSRKSVDENFVANLTRDKHVIIYGSSKQGKTSLRKNCLKDDDYIVVHCSNKWGIAELHAAILKRVGYEVTQSSTKTTTGKNKIVASFKATFLGTGVEASGEKEDSKSTAVVKTPLELDPEDVNDIITALADFRRFIVLEDFHYLPIDTQKDFSVALKAFHEQSKLCFIIVGVWLEEGRLTVYNGDLTGRVVAVNADKWTKVELAEVIAAAQPPGHRRESWGRGIPRMPLPRRWCDPPTSPAGHRGSAARMAGGAPGLGRGPSCRRPPPSRCRSPEGSRSSRRPRAHRRSRLSMPWASEHSKPATRCQASSLAAAVGLAARHAVPRRRPMSLGSEAMVAWIIATSARPSSASWPTMSQRRSVSRLMPGIVSLPSAWRQPASATPRTRRCPPGCAPR